MSYIIVGLCIAGCVINAVSGNYAAMLYALTGALGWGLHAASGR